MLRRVAWFPFLLGAPLTVGEPLGACRCVLYAGCAFVIMARRLEADQAIKNLHGKHTITGMANALQLSYAKVKKKSDLNLVFFYVIEALRFA
jgi:hypothetical protein